MPCDYKKYPPHWKEFRQQVMNRADYRCECEGECGLHKTNPGPRRCNEIHGRPALWAKGAIVLTIAHLDAAGGICDCSTPCAIPEHVKALCQRCHLRYDTPRHVANAKATVARKKAARMQAHGHTDLPI